MPVVVNGQAQPPIPSPVAYPMANGLVSPSDPVLSLSKHIIPNPSADPTTKYFCSLCNLALSGYAPVQQHLDCDKHRRLEGVRGAGLLPLGGSFLYYYNLL